MDDLAVPGGLAVATFTGSGFTTALFVRDLLGLSVAAHVPRLTPVVNARGRSQGDATIAVAWSTWWSDIEAAAAGQQVTPGDPGLHQVLDQEGTPARTWGEAEADDAARDYRPAWLPQLLASGEGVGRHDTEIIPIAEPWSASLRDRRLLVSTGLYRDHAAMDVLWQSRLTTLLA